MTKRTNGSAGKRKSEIAKADARSFKGTAPSVRDLLADSSLAFTPSESKIAQVLLADYPRAGLGSASALARRASVSDPTVVRLTTKLGFPSFSDFQAQLLAEVEERLRSPLMMMERRAATEKGAAEDYMASVAQRIIETSEAAVDDAYRRASEMILESKSAVKLVGGRFSRHVAAIMAGYLSQFRKGVDLIAPVSAESVDQLLDLGRKDVLIVFDYRRYQTDVIALVRQAASRNVRIILFTDPWLSPLAEVAEVIFIAPPEVNSPYDSLAPAMAQMEALIAHLVAKEPEKIEKRVAELESLRPANSITEDAGEKRATLSAKDGD